MSTADEITDALTRLGYEPIRDGDWHPDYGWEFSVEDGVRLSEEAARVAQHLDDTMNDHLREPVHPVVPTSDGDDFELSLARPASPEDQERLNQLSAAQMYRPEFRLRSTGDESYVHLGWYCPHDYPALLRLLQMMELSRE